MPKQLKTITPLRQVRVATKMTQAKFAERVGIRYDLYQSLELGRAFLTAENARKILRATGALPSSLDPKRSDGAKSVFDPKRPYCRDSWEAWESGSKEGWEEESFRLAPSLIGWTQLVCLAARDKRKFWQVLEMLSQALEDIVRECKLDMEDILAKKLKHHVMRVSYTYGELRENPGLAKSVGFKDKRYERGEEISDDKLWKGKIDLAGGIGWDPSSWMPASLIDKMSNEFREFIA